MNNNESGERIVQSEVHQFYIEVKDLKKVYNDFAAVKNNTFCVKKGEIFGLLGPNGAGKSTTFNVLSMRSQRSGGEVRLLN
jgi:ABC-type multidrug transport system ATPase subunit